MDFNEDRALIEKFSRIANIWDSTEINLVDFNYIWTIKQFNSFDKVLKSPKFNYECSEFEIILKQCDNSSWLCLELVTAALGTKCSFSLLNGNGEEINQKSGSLRYVNFIERHSLRPNETIIDSNVHILCKISFMQHIITNEFPKNVEICHSPDDKLCENYKSLVGDSKHSDVILIVDKQEVPAHKAILAARSIVFAAMFEHDLEEKKSNRVEITDINYETLMELLSFIYTGISPNINQMADYLLAAADKYALENLKISCGNILCAGLSIETASKTLLLSDIYGMENLKARAFLFIRSKINEIIKTEGWSELIETHPHLIAEVLAELVKK